VAKACSSPLCARWTRLRSESFCWTISRTGIGLTGIGLGVVAEITQVATVVSFDLRVPVFVLSTIPGASGFNKRLAAPRPASHQGAPVIDYETCCTGVREEKAGVWSLLCACFPRQNFFSMARAAEGENCEAKTVADNDGRASARVSPIRECDPFRATATAFRQPFRFRR
jgi:hypothetical protein